MSDLPTTSDVLGPTPDEADLPEPTKPLPGEIAKRRYNTRVETITVQQIETFLTNLAETGAVLKSCHLAGLGYFTIRRFRKDEPEFRELFEEAMESYRDLLIGEAHRRAIDGWDEPVFSQRLGTQMGTVRKYDSRLLELLLKRHIPEFREKFEGEIKVSGGVLVAPVAVSSLAEWANQNKDASYEVQSPTPPKALPEGGKDT